jgi:hypothetical protein
MQPIVVMACSGYERLQADVAALAEAGAVKQLPGLLGRFLQRKTGVASLEGLDQRRPLGFIVVTDGLAIVPMAFVPVNDGPKLLASLEKLVGKPQQKNQGLWKIGQGQLTGFVKLHGDWAFVAQSEENFGWLPKPEKLLGDLPRRFDLVLQLNFQHLPEVFRTMAVDFLRLAMRSNLARRENESEAAHDLRQRLASWRFRIFEHLLTESRQITLGYSFDERTKQMTWDLRLTPEPESNLARQLATLRQGKTRFGDLGRGDDFLSLHLNWLLDDGQIDRLAADVRASRAAAVRYVGELPGLKTDEERRTFQQAAGSLLDVLEKTIRTGHLDVAVAARAPPAADGAEAELPVTLLAAAHVGHGEPLRKALADVARLGKENPRFAAFKLNAAFVKKTPVHAVLFSAETQPLARRLLGDNLNLFVAVADDSLWGAIGKDSLAALERSLTRRETELPPLQLRFRLRPLIRMAEEFTQQRVLSLLVSKTDDSDDRIMLTVAADDQGLHARLTANEGVSRLLARALAVVLSLGG